LRGVAVVLERTDRHRGASEVVGRDAAAVDRDDTAGRVLGEAHKLIGWRFREYLHASPGRRQQLGFPSRLRIAARHHGAPALKGKEYRQPRQRVHARRLKIGREAGRSHRVFRY